MQIRRLTVKDRKIFTNLIKKLVEKTGEKDLLRIIRSSTEETEENESDKSSFAISIAIRIFNSLLEVLNEEVTEWFSDLIGVSKEEFDKLPITTEIEIVKQIIESEDFVSFLSTASSIYKRIEGLRKKQ